MKNFEDALMLIEILETENQELKNRIADLIQPEIDTQVGSDYKIRKIKMDAQAAMKRFTAKLKAESKKNREKKNGS